jgi:hypothetical protein
MQQESLFIESREDAVKALAQRLGGLKRLAAYAWPTEDVDKAHQRLIAKLDPSRREILSADDWDLLVRIGAEHECHILKWWTDDTQGYQRSQPTEPRDADDELAARIEQATVVLAKSLDIYTRRQAARTLKTIKTAT